MTMLRCFALLIIYSLFAVLPAAAQHAVLQGTVSDERGAPLPLATVVLVDTNHGTSTRDDRAFAISGIAPGTYSVRVSMVGFRPAARTIALSAGEVAKL